MTPWPSSDASGPVVSPWLGVATALGVVSALPLLGPLPGAGGAGPRALAFAFVLGQMLALGFAAAAVESLSRRLLPERPALRLAALIGLWLGLGAFVLAPDLENFTLRTVGRSRELWLRGALVTAAAAGLGLAFALSRRLSAAGRFGWGAPAVGAILVALANTRLLPGDYPGVHAALLSLAGLMGRGAFYAARHAEWADRSRVALTVAGALAVAAVLVPPPPAARLALAPLSAAVLADHLPPWGAVGPDTVAGAAPVDLPAALRPYFERGRAEQTRPPTTPSLFGSEAAAPIVLLLTVDSMRSEVLANPANVARLPTLHRLRDGGFFVPRAVSPSTVTRFTMASLFTGLNVPSLRWIRDSATQGSLIKEPRRRLAEHLDAGGVETLHVVTQYELVNIKANAIGRGFADEVVLPPAAGARVAYAPAVTDAIIARLERAVAAPTRPLFVFSHLMDAHHPWDTGRTAGADAGPYDRFVAELENVDAALARLDAGLTERGLWPRTLLIVAADHGQAFGQHGWPYHGGAPYEEQIRVPLIVYGPAVRPARSPCDLPLLDLTPTILDVFGRPTPGDVVGYSLVPALRGDAGGAGAVICGRPLYSSTWDMFGLITPDGRKVIDNRRKRTRELFDLLADPAETRNLCPDDPTACDTAIGLLGRYLELQGFIPPPK